MAGTGVGTWSARAERGVENTDALAVGTRRLSCGAIESFLTTACEGGRRVSLLAFRRADGRLLWETPGASRPHGFGRPLQERPRLGDAGDRRRTRLRVVRRARPVRRSRFTGKIVWQRDLGAMGVLRRCGVAAAVRDRIILYQDQYRGSFIAAFDAHHGRDIWRTPARPPATGGAHRSRFGSALATRPLST